MDRICRIRKGSFIPQTHEAPVAGPGFPGMVSRSGRPALCISPLATNWKQYFVCSPAVAGRQFQVPPCIPHPELQFDAICIFSRLAGSRDGGTGYWIFLVGYWVFNSISLHLVIMGLAPYGGLPRRRGVATGLVSQMREAGCLRVIPV